MSETRGPFFTEVEQQAIAATNRLGRKESLSPAGFSPLEDSVGGLSVRMAVTEHELAIIGNELDALQDRLARLEGLLLPPNEASLDEEIGEAFRQARMVHE